MGKNFERIDKTFQEILSKKLIEKKEEYNNLSKIDKEKYEKFIKKYKEYENKYSSKNKAVKNKLKEVSYDNLIDILELLDISIKDLYSIVGIDIKWPNKNFEILANNCDSLEDNMLNKLYELSKKMSTTYWESCSDEGLSPTKRIINIFIRKYSRSERRLSDVYPFVQKAWEDQKMFTNIDTINLPYISDKLGVSLMWLMSLENENITILAKKNITEKIMIAYSFMDDSTKLYFSYIVNSIVCKEDK